jgi:hypothetical protein
VGHLASPFCNDRHEVIRNALKELKMRDACVDKDFSQNYTQRGSGEQFDTEFVSKVKLPLLL